MKWNQTALYSAAGNGHLAVISALIKAGAKVNSIDKDGRTPIIHAIEQGKLGCVKELLYAGAVITREDSVNI